jgi:hypothetical protein
MSALTPYERETHITYSYGDNIASVYTFDRKLQNKLNKLAQSRSDVVIIKQDEECTEYEVPKSFIKVSPPRQVNYTEEQKVAMAERLAAAREKGKEQNA